MFVPGSTSRGSSGGRAAGPSVRRGVVVPTRKTRTMMESNDTYDEVPGLPREVLEQIRAKLGSRGDKVVACLKTAAVFVEQAHEDAGGLRLAESAAYNLREALDAIVAGKGVPGGGLGDVQRAWKRYQAAVSGPDADIDAARAEFDGVIGRIAGDEDRQAFKTRKLLEYVRELTGVEPLPGDHDPTVRYARLRRSANNVLHDEGAAAAVADLYDEVVTWLIGFFTPPGERVRAITALAERPYADGAIDELRRHLSNAHHVRLFCSRLRDDAWLEPLCEAGLLSLPRAGEPWPVAALVGGAIEPRRVAEVLSRLLKAAGKGPAALGAAREILRLASSLGVAGDAVAAKIVARYPQDDWVQVIATSISREREPSDPVQLAMAKAVVGNERRRDGAYRTRAILGRLAEGLTESNVRDRFGLVADQLRRLAGDTSMRLVSLDIAALHVDDNDELREVVLVLAQRLVRMIPAARRLGVSTAELLALAKEIPGELGERIVCQVLADASDVDREVKLQHVERRMRSTVATGDDRDLIEDLRSTGSAPAELARLRAALGEPSTAPEGHGPDFVAADWLRGWRWSLVLPEEVLEHWAEPIAAVTARYGSLSATALDAHVPRILMETGSSPYSRDHLAALPVDDAAHLVTGWRPGRDTGSLVSVRELARELQAVVTQDPRAWTEDPVAVVSALREPVYVDHYFRAVSASAEHLADRADALLAAVDVIRAERWEPTPLGDDSYDYDADWSTADTTIVDAIAALANKNATLAGVLNACWRLVTELLARRSKDSSADQIEEDDSDELNDPLNRAINRPYGRALLAALALGGWEHRNQGAASARLGGVLDEILAVPGVLGLELRAVLAAYRPLVETIVPTWLHTYADDLFTAKPLGPTTFEQTLKYSKPTRWFLERFADELAAAARRGTENAVGWLLVAVLWDVPSYTAGGVTSALAGNVPALRAAAERIAWLMQPLEAGDPMIERGLRFWNDLIEADRSVVPAAVLAGAGRWIFVTAITPEQWLTHTTRTLDITAGVTDMAIEIADRCKEIQPSSQALRILRLMIGHGEPWEQHHVESAGVDALRLAADSDVDDEFEQLRTRLIERGRHEATDIER